MTPLQIIIAIIGGLIVLSYFVDFKVLLSKFKQEEATDMSKEKDTVIKLQEKQTTLSDIVAQWEALKNHCEERELVEAVAKLEEVFPLLIKKA